MVEEKKQIECAGCGRTFIKKTPQHYCCSAKCMRLVRGSAWKWIREAALLRDADTCQKCGASDCPLDAHHLQPLCCGGSNDLDNLTSLCRPCHHTEHRSWVQTINQWKEVA